ncbi:MAG: hypothetical protein ACF8QF_09530 [Phycisphaerales bacterium]
MIRTVLAAAALMGIGVGLVGCTASGSTGEEKRAAIMEMHDETLQKLYSAVPSARDEVRGAPGYAVFSNVGVKVIFVGGGGGYGVAVDNNTSDRTYMKMGEANVGIGLGVKDFRAVFIFETEDAMTNFVENGWTATAEADAAAKADESGGAASGRLQLGDITVYQLTEDGLALAASIGGTKYWKDASLN